MREEESEVLEVPISYYNCNISFNSYRSQLMDFKIFCDLFYKDPGIYFDRFITRHFSLGKIYHFYCCSKQHFRILHIYFQFVVGVYRCS